MKSAIVAAIMMWVSASVGTASASWLTKDFEDARSWQDVEGDARQAKEGAPTIDLDRESVPQSKNEQVQETDAVVLQAQIEEAGEHSWREVEEQFDRPQNDAWRDMESRFVSEGGGSLPIWDQDWIKQSDETFLRSFQVVEEEFRAVSLENDMLDPDHAQWWRRL